VRTFAQPSHSPYGKDPIVQSTVSGHVWTKIKIFQGGKQNPVHNPTKCPL
jgi:hypothetical protein